MASFFPDGSTLHIASDVAAAKKITVLTNARPAVATCTAHGLQNGDMVVLSSGWGSLDERVFKVIRVDENSFKLDGVDTADVKRFPAGAGVGSFRKITAWTQIRQIADSQAEGGEQQYANFSYLEEKVERQMPTTRSARKLRITIGDDTSLPGYQAAKAASDAGGLTPLRMDLPSGSQIFYNGYVSLDEVPKTSKGELMTVTLDYALSGDPVRY